MDVRAINKAFQRHFAARVAVEHMKKETDLNRYSAHWYQFLTSWHSIFKLLAIGAEATLANKQWYAQRERLILSDAMFAYLAAASESADQNLDASVSIQTTIMMEAKPNTTYTVRIEAHEGEDYVRGFEHGGDEMAPPTFSDPFITFDPVTKSDGQIVEPPPLWNDIVPSHVWAHKVAATVLEQTAQFMKECHARVTTLPSAPVQNGPNVGRVTKLDWTDSERAGEINHCIYCGSTTDLTDEHVIPKGLRGDLILPKSSCTVCNRETTKFERFVQRNSFGHIRGVLGLRSKRRKEIPTQAFLSSFDDDVVAEHPYSPDSPSFFHMGMTQSQPGMLIGMPNDDSAYEYHALEYGRLDNYEKFKPFQLENVKISAQFRADTFFRMIAKIAHAFAYTKYSPAEFTPLLQSFIINGEGSAAYYIGSNEAAASDNLHSLFAYPQVVNRQTAIGIVAETYLLVDVRILQIASAPIYTVVVGKMKFATNCAS